MEQLQKTERLELCRLIRDGIEANLFMGQKLLEEELGGTPRDLKAVARLLLTKLSLKTTQKFCDPYLKEENIEQYDKSIDKIIEDFIYLEGE